MASATAFDDSLRLLGNLRRRLSRGGRPVVLHETHLSWVLLAGRLAVKIKKPVRLPFVDFSTPQARRQACDAELRLNSRLAPALYRRVVDVGGSLDAPRFGGCSPPIDALVCMRRFGEGALMSEALAAGRLAPRHLERLALRVARFHEAAEVVSDGGDPARRSIEPVAQVIDQLARFEDGTWIRNALRWLDEEGRRLTPTFRRRLADGAVRDGHGDLHLANAVVLGDDATAFDCIEFDPSLRRIDVMADIAFMTMDLEAHGRPDLAHRFLDACLEARGDFEGLAVLRFHEVARACVRRLVQRLGPGGVAAGDVDYLVIANRKMSNPPTPRLAITSGPSGSGKSTVAARLVDVTGAIRVRSDVERKRLAMCVQDDGPLYGTDMTRRTYTRLATCARLALSAGYDVIVDAACLRRRQRDEFARLAAELGVAFTVLAFDAPAAELARRVRRRLSEAADPSDADEAVLASQLRDRDPIGAVEEGRTIRIDTGRAVDATAVVATWRARA
ncbi:MAG TPA: AAA family ATPase [Burkholderiaceae bacterium]